MASQAHIVTAAVWPAETPRFSRPICTKRTHGKSGRRGWSRRRNRRGHPITSARRLETRRRDLTRGGPWSSSTPAIDAYELLLAVISVALENTATHDNPALTRGQLDQVLGAAPGRARNDQALRTLLTDSLITLTASGGCAVLDAPPDPSADPYPGWQGPDPATLPPLRKLPHLKPAEQRELMLRLYRQVQAEGLPKNLHLHPSTEQQYAAARKKDAVALPSWAWAWLINRNLPEGRHPVSGRTASTRLAELGDVGELVRVKRARHRFDPQGWTFRSLPAWWALPGPSVQPERRRKRRRSMVPNLAAGGVTRSAAWRLQQARWQSRDDEAWQHIWNPA